MSKEYDQIKEQIEKDKFVENFKKVAKSEKVNSDLTEDQIIKDYWKEGYNGEQAWEVSKVRKEKNEEIITELKKENEKAQHIFYNYKELKKQLEERDKTVETLKIDNAVIQKKYEKLLEESSKSETNELDKIADGSEIEFKLIGKLQRLFEEKIEVHNKGKFDIEGDRATSILSEKDKLHKKEVNVDEIHKIFDQCEAIAKKKIELNEIAEWRLETKQEVNLITKNC